MKESLPDTAVPLSARFALLVQEHLGHGPTVAAGPRTLPGKASALAATQAAWRFFNQERLSLPTLAQPLLDWAQRAVQECCQRYALVAPAWSNVDYRTPTRKQGRVALSNGAELGYALRSALVLSDQGEVLAPVCQDLRAAAGVPSSRQEKRQPSGSCLDELAPVLSFLAARQLGVPVVPRIDREADAVGH